LGPDFGGMVKVNRFGFFISNKFFFFDTGFHLYSLLGEKASRLV
jgi:hypothetical protein